MLKFIKIKAKYPSGKEVPAHWRLVLSTEQDVLSYITRDQKLNISGYFREIANPSHDYRGENMKAIVQIEAEAKGKVFPLDAINGVMRLKAEGMLRGIDAGEILSINEAGGYCYLDGYLDQFLEYSIIETVEKTDFGFPVDTEVINSEVLVLENDKNIHPKIISYFEKNDITTYQALLNLKEIDLNYTFKAIENAKKIAICSQFIDPDQLETFFKLFASDEIEPKTIIIGSDRDLSIIKNHNLFNICNSKHRLIFI